MSTYITALVAGPYVSRARRARRHPARHLLPRVAGAAPRPRRPVHGHQAGLRLLPPGVRLPVPVRQVRPAVRAGVQRRRDGERRLRHVPRGLRLPVQGDRRGLRAARRDGAARDGAHVVRRPRDHALVGRPVAQRVLRDVHVGARQVEATRYTRGWTTFANTEKTWAYRQDQLPSTHPIAADIPDIEAVKVNFDGITYAKGASVLKQLVAWVGQEAFLSALRRLLQRRTSTATPCSRDLLGRARARQRPRPVRLVGGVARDGRRQHAARVVRDRRRRRLHRRSRSLQEAPRAVADAAVAPRRDRPLRPGRRPAGAHAPRGARRRRRQDRRAGAGGPAASPTWCSSTTTT